MVITRGLVSYNIDSPALKCYYSAELRITTMQNSLAFIVIGYNEVSLTLRCIESILRFEPKCTVYYLDNASYDGSFLTITNTFTEKIHSYSSSENLGVAKGRNYLSKKVTEDILVFIDNDAYLEASVSAQVFKMLDGNNGVIGHQGLFCDDEFNIYTKNTFSQRTDGVSGYFLATKMETFQSVHCFNEEYTPYGCEDIDYCLKVKSAGLSITATSDFPVVHTGNQSSNLIDNIVSIKVRSDLHFKYKWQGSTSILEISRLNLNTIQCDCCNMRWERKFVNTKSAQDFQEI